MTLKRSSQSRSRSGRTLTIPRIVAGGLLACGLLAGGAWSGYQWGLQSQAAAAVTASELRQMLSTQRHDLDAARNQTRNHLDALALRLGAMQSELYRIEALGAALAKAGKLDLDEFNFSEPPPRGGLEDGGDAASVELSELLAEMDQLARSIDDRAHKLSLMQGMIVDGRIQANLKPKGRPVRKGWVSSNYGYRKDPFTGKKNFHHGVDIAGKKNSEVFAVASGVVTDAGRKSGYGYLVEIVHADGLVTRYGHNSKIFVEKGDLVAKGQTIGLMGSTGRSTGPHVHFEIARNGKSIDPSQYLQMQ